MLADARPRSTALQSLLRIKALAFGDSSPSGRFHVCICCLQRLTLCFGLVSLCLNGLSYLAFPWFACCHWSTCLFQLIYCYQMTLLRYLMRNRLRGCWSSSSLRTASPWFTLHVRSRPLLSVGARSRVAGSLGSHCPTITPAAATHATHGRSHIANSRAVSSIASRPFEASSHVSLDRGQGCYTYRQV